MNLSLKNVHRYYDKDGYKTHALDDVDLTLQDGDQVMIVGESGSGKSTLLNVVGMLDRGYQGTYSIDGKNARQYGKRDQATMRNKMFGYIFQEYALLESESIYENVKIPLLYSHVKRSERSGYIDDVLKKVGLYEMKDKKVKYLSGGQRQRVAIARSLVNQPRIILADEPTGSLDERNRDVILDIIYNYLDDSKILLFVTHDLKNNRRGNQKVIQISQGKLMQV